MKVTDSRADAYIREFGGESWELDALNPETLSELVRSNIASIRDEDLWAEAVAKEEEDIETITKMSTYYDEVQEFLFTLDAEED